MFRNSYQRKLLTVLYSSGSNPLEIWDIQVRNGWTRRVKDDDLGSLVFEIAGTNVATAYIVSPPDPKSALGITLPFITMFIKNLKRYFTFEIQILDDKNMRRRFRFSNYQSATRIRPFACSVPLALKPGWNQMQLNLADFTTRAYGTNYMETQRVQIHANCRVRRVYFSDRLYTDEDLPKDYRVYMNVRQAARQTAAQAEVPEFKPGQRSSSLAAPLAPVSSKEETTSISSAMKQPRTIRLVQIVEPAEQEDLSEPGDVVERIDSRHSRQRLSNTPIDDVQLRQSNEFHRRFTNQQMFEVERRVSKASRTSLTLPPVAENDETELAVEPNAAAGVSQLTEEMADAMPGVADQETEEESSAWGIESETGMIDDTELQEALQSDIEMGEGEPEEETEEETEEEVQIHPQYTTEKKLTLQEEKRASKSSAASKTDL